MAGIPIFSLVKPPLFRGSGDPKTHNDRCRLQCPPVHLSAHLHWIHDVDMDMILLFGHGFLRSKLPNLEVLPFENANLTFDESLTSIDLKEKNSRAMYCHLFQSRP